MFGIIFLTLISLIFIIFLVRFLTKGSRYLAKEREAAYKKYNDLSLLNISLRQANAKLEKSTEDIIALYNVTKDICRSLEQKKVFDSFCEQAAKYMSIGDCKFLSFDADLSPFNNYTRLPISIGKNKIGHLVASGVSESDNEKLEILSHQFALGLNRAILYSRVQELAITDSLTGAFSRRYLMERLDEELRRAKQFSHKLCFLMADVDNFKSYNDRYGHLVGDIVLREVVACIKDSVRQVDLVGRYGGEEFCVVLTQTDVGSAKIVAERIRRAIESIAIKAYDELLKVTISIGIAQFPLDADVAWHLIDKADKALYKAKQAGRNRTFIYESK